MDILPSQFLRQPRWVGSWPLGLAGLPQALVGGGAGEMVLSHARMDIRWRDALIALQRAVFSECSAHDSGGRQLRMAAGV